MDRISELPHCVLSYILSMLPIKDLLKTCVLSTRWSNLWLLRRDLNFDIANMFGEIETSDYGSGSISPLIMETEQLQQELLSIDLKRTELVQRVNQFLQKFSNNNNNTNNKIDSLKVAHCFNIGQSSSIDQWISFAITRGVERIDLIFEGIHNVSASELYVFPLFVLFSNSTHSTLKHIHLHSCTVAAAANLLNNNNNNNPFCNLRSLVLDNVHILGGQDLITNLLSQCVQLEKLSLIQCQFPLLKNGLKIVSPSLLHLKFHQFRQNQISFHCPKLSSLECYANVLGLPGDIPFCYKRIFSCCCPTKAPLLNRVLFHIYPTSAMPDVLASLPNLPQLEILSLDVGLTVNISLVGNSLPTLAPFKNLKQLNLLIDGDNLEELEFEFDNLWIFTILKACPLLQKLSIKIFNPKLLSNQKESRDFGMFSHSELKVVEVEGCVGNWYEIEFAMNILKYVDTLEQIIMMSPSGKCLGYPDSNWYSSNVKWFPNGWEKAREIARQA